MVLGWDLRASVAFIARLVHVTSTDVMFSRTFASVKRLEGVKKTVTKAVEMCDRLRSKCVDIKKFQGKTERKMYRCTFHFVTFSVLVFPNFFHSILYAIRYCYVVSLVEFRYSQCGSWCRWWRGVVVNALVAINEVTLRRARLVLGWVTVCGRVNHLGM